MDCGGVESDMDRDAFTRVHSLAWKLLFLHEMKMLLHRSNQECGIGVTLRVRYVLLQHQPDPLVRDSAAHDTRAVERQGENYGWCGSVVTSLACAPDIVVPSPVSPKIVENNCVTNCATRKDVVCGRPPVKTRVWEASIKLASAGKTQEEREEENHRRDEPAEWDVFVDGHESLTGE